MAPRRDPSLMRSHGVVDSATTETPRVIPSLEIEGIQNLEPVSVGGTATMYRGVQTTIGRQVAVKVLNEELTSENGQRFDRERTLTGELSGHANIVCLFDTGVTTHDAPYLVMPFFPRGSLAGLIDEHGPLGWQEATFLMEPIAVALAEIHSRDIAHRNLKPATVMLTDFLLPRVADFERALAIGETPSRSEPGAARFFSPTDPTGPASPIEDVYGLGALLWALLAGQAQFGPASDGSLAGQDAPTATILARQGRLPAPVEPPCQPILDLVARAMSADLLRRPANAAAFVTELRRSVTRVDQPSSDSGRPVIRHPLTSNSAPPDLTKLGIPLTVS